jgi:hypothetical protein
VIGDFRMAGVGHDHGRWPGKVIATKARCPVRADGRPMRAPAELPQSE